MSGSPALAFDVIPSSGVRIAQGFFVVTVTTWLGFPKTSGPDIGQMRYEYVRPITTSWSSNRQKSALHDPGSMDQIGKSSAYTSQP